MEIAATTAVRPGPKGSEAYASGSDQGVLNGVAVDDISPQSRQEFNIPADLQGALITQVDPSSAAAQAGISAGDVILDIDRHRVHSAQEAINLCENATTRKTLLRLWSHGDTIFVVVDESQPGS
jgi:serine protease Do